MRSLNRVLVLSCGLWISLGMVHAEIPPGNCPDYPTVSADFVGVEGNVDYRRSKAEHQDRDEFLGSLAAGSPAAFSDRPARERIALGIDASNGSTPEWIIDHYPVRGPFLRSLTYPKNSVRQILGDWNQITLLVLGRGLTLGHIEHSIPRGTFAAPGISRAGLPRP